jgi:phosphate transport system substrate-binding protein
MRSSRRPTYSTKEIAMHSASFHAAETLAPATPRLDRPVRKAALLASLLMGCVTLFAPCAAQEKVVVGGAGSMVPVIQELVRAYEAKGGAKGIEVITSSLGSGGGIKGVEAGRLTIGLTGRGLKDAEKGAVQFRQLAVMPVVIAANGAVQASAVSSTQLCGIYSGAIKSWSQVGGPDAAIVPLTRNEDDSDKEALRQIVGCYKTLKESADVVVLSSGSGMTSALTSRPGTIGLTTYDALLKSKGRIKALALDGVVPNPETVAAGKYPLVKAFAVVTRGEPQGAVKGFLDFIAGTEGRAILVDSGLVPQR